MEVTEGDSKDIVSKDLSDNSPPSSLDKELPAKQEALVGTTSEELPEYMSGWRLYTLTFGLCLALFIAQMETSIVSTSIISVTNDLGGFVESSWVFTAYLLTYSGLVIIWAKSSDIFGRKPIILLGLVIFIIFSAACGAAQTLTQLIAFRCLQGLGGSGIFSITIVIIFEMVPSKRLPTYTAVATLVFTCSVTFGPLLGGAITNHTTWRWIFLLNVPIGALSLILLMLFLPFRLAGQPQSTLGVVGAESTFSMKTIRRLDILGAALLLGACVFIATALQQTANGSSFASAAVLTLFILSCLFWVGFVLWQWNVTKRQYPEPVFPWRLFQSRVYMGMIINTFCVGSMLTVLTIQLPQRFQTVNGQTPMAAGIRLLAFGLVAQAGSVISAVIIGKTKIPPIYHILFGSVLQVVGTIGLSRASLTSEIEASQYAWQVVAGLGVGFCNVSLVLLVKSAAQKIDQAVGTAAMTQFRVLGGILSLAIVISVMNRKIRSDLLQVLPQNIVYELLQTTSIIHTLSEETQDVIGAIFGKGYNLQMRIMIGFAAAQLPASALMWTKEPMMVEK